MGPWLLSTSENLQPSVVILCSICNGPVVGRRYTQSSERRSWGSLLIGAWCEMRQEVASMDPLVNECY